MRRAFGGAGPKPPPPKRPPRRPPPPPRSPPPTHPRPAKTDWVRRHGNTFSFDSSGRLTNILDQYSQALNVAYVSSTSSLPSTVTDWKSRRLTFSYLNGALTNVSDGTRSVGYGYRNNSSGQSDLTS